MRRLDTGGAVWGSNLSEVKFYAPVETVPGAYPSSYITGTWSFLGVERTGRGVNGQG